MFKSIKKEVTDLGEDPVVVFEKAQAISAAEFHCLLKQMPEELRNLRIVYTEKQFNVKPLSIPIEAIRNAARMHSDGKMLSRFGLLLQCVANGDVSSPFEEPITSLPFQSSIYEIALCAVAVCICTCRTSLRLNLAVTLTLAELCYFTKLPGA